MAWRFLVVLIICFLLAAANDTVDLIAPEVERTIRHQRKEPGVCSEACYQVATCNEEIGGRCYCPKHLSGLDCNRNATESRFKAYGQSKSLEARSPMPCLNSCNQRGYCVWGTCVCDRGNYTSDCSMSLDKSGKPLLLAGSDYKPRERRPRIYVYDVPHKYSSWHNPARVDRALHWVFWERLLGSGVLVADGEEADWFWLPIKLRSTTDGYRLLETIDYVREEWPWYDRLQGHRHFVIHTGDTGRGEVPDEVRSATANMTWLHHWGLERDWDSSGWKAAHRPGKDVVIPVYFGARHSVGPVTMSGLHPRAPRWQRPGTLLFAGRICGDYSKPDPKKPWPHCVTDKSPGYSQGVRQLVHFHHHNRSGYKIVTGTGRYVLDLLTFQWCLAPSGGGHGHRQVLVSMMGCLPLVISDGVLQPFEPEMDWDQFGLRMAHADIPRLHEILAGFTEEQLERKRAALRCAVQHMLFSSIGGGLMQEDGRWDAFEFILEILRMQQTYPGLDPRQYADTDEQYRAFLCCGDPDGMEAYGAKLQAAHLERYPTTLLPQLPVSNGGDGADAADDGPEDTATAAAVTGPGKMTMPKLNQLLREYAEKQDRVTNASPLKLCSSSLWDYKDARCHASKPSLIGLVAGGAACMGHEDNLAECPRLWP